MRYLGPVLLLAVLPCPVSVSAAGWQQQTSRLQQEVDQAAAALEQSHERLVEQAEARSPELLERLEPAPPEPLISGYAVLPELKVDTAAKPSRPREIRYSLDSLSSRSSELLRDADQFAKLLAEDRGDTPLSPLVERFEGLRASLDSVCEHLAYHAFWQQAVVEHREFFDERRELLERVRDWRKRVNDRGNDRRARKLQRQLIRDIAPFKAVPGLSLTTDERGGKRLVVPLTTDIEDERFLEAFRDGVLDAWSRSSIALERDFAVDLVWRRVSPRSLYPDGVPVRGSTIELSDHLARFPQGTLVLTTGGASTHARIGRYIQLGPAAISPRTLAHEFGHLLGFQDTYLRADDGDPEEPFGVVLVEWQGLSEDLMGDSGAGEVTREMIKQLERAYRP